MNTLFDGIYCLNLPSSKDRRFRMEREFTKNDCQATFISGISPLDPGFRHKKKRKLDPHMRPRCYCIKKCMHRSRALRDSEIAISLSHLKIYKHIVENNKQINLIVEDDVVLHSNIINILEYLFTRGLKNILLSENPVVVFCGGRNNPGLSIKEPESYQYKVTKNGYYSNYCCIMNKACAEALVKNAVPISRPDDSYKRYLAGKGIIQAYHIIPSLVAELSAGINTKPVYSRLSKANSHNEIRESLRIRTHPRLQRSRPKE